LPRTGIWACAASSAAARLQFLSDLSESYRSSGKISYRAWFSPEEYRALYMAIRTALDIAAINVRRERPRKVKSGPRQEPESPSED
jgi:hypothetical protein